MILQPTAVSTKEFTKSGDHLYVSEASSLPAPSRVYDDAIDLGFTMVNSQGKRVVIAEFACKYDADGDLLYTDYKPLAIYRQTFTIRIFND